MGAAQSVPLVGEAVTALDCTVKLAEAATFATIGLITDDDDFKREGENFLKDAGNTWVEYSERNVLVAPVRALINKIDGDDEEGDRIMNKMVKSAEQVIDSTPVVGHAKGVYHYIAGDTEHGNDCMKDATGSLAVLGAGALTGGVGVGVVAGGLAGVSTGVAYDSVVTVTESAVKNENRPYGIIAAIDKGIECHEERDAHGLLNSVIDVSYSLVGDFATGCAASDAVGKRMNKASKQRQAMRKEIGKGATKDVTDAAKQLKKTVKNVEGDNHVYTKTKNLETGNEAYGANRRLRQELRVAEFESKGEASGYTSKTNAKKSYGGEFRGDVGLLEETGIEMDMNIESQYPGRSLDACAEHQAIDRLGTHGAKANIRTTTVKCNKGKFTALKRCDNCVQYGDLMGQVPTDTIHGMPVPTRQFVLDKSWPAVRGAALHAGFGVICAYCGEADDCTQGRCSGGRWRTELPRPQKVDRHMRSLKLYSRW